MKYRTRGDLHYFLVFMFKFFFSINGLVWCALLCRWCLKTAVEQFRWKELFSLWFVVEWAGRGGDGNWGSYVYCIFDRVVWFFTFKVLNHFPHNLKRVKLLNAMLGKNYEEILSGQYTWTCCLSDLNVLHLSSTCVGTTSRPVQSGNHINNIDGSAQELHELKLALKENVHCLNITHLLLEFYDVYTNFVNRSWINS